MHNQNPFKINQEIFAYEGGTLTAVFNTDNEALSCGWSPKGVLLSLDTNKPYRGVYFYSERKENKNDN